MKKVVIIGGGLSGLCARYMITQQYPDISVTLYEKNDRLGGCIQSMQSPFFERGPRTIKASRSQELLALIDELGLGNKVITSSRQAKRRYIFKDGKLHALKQLIPSFVLGAINEWRQDSVNGDETIASFAHRRFGAFIAENVFDPLTLGVFAGNSRELSVSACFPELKRMELSYGSLTRAAFLQKHTHTPHKGLVSLDGGLEELIHELIVQGRGDIYLNTTLTTFPQDGITILAVPPSQARLFFPCDRVVQSFFSSIGSKPLTVVNCMFPHRGLHPEGFGYLVPTSQRENVLGVVFDSSVFPTQSVDSHTQLTVMLKNGDVEEALSVLHRHLGITGKASFTQVTHYAEAVPQFYVGHLSRVKGFSQYLNIQYPNVYCIGNYLEGVSLNSCVKQAFKCVKELI